MVTETSNQSESGIATLVGGIINDLQKLITQQFAMLRLEILDEIRQFKTVAISLAVGVVATVAGALLLPFMLVYLLAAYTPIPLWGCYGVVAGTVVGIGLVLLFLGGRKASHLHIKPSQTTEALKENFRWLKNETFHERI